MIQSPIHRALSTFSTSGLQYLLMGGQACILYGAAEFSRDIDISISADPASLAALSKSLKQLGAENIHVPELGPAALLRGHACHFRCHTLETEGLRIDVMTTMRGCAPFDVLWQQRTVIELPEIGEVCLLSLPDLVNAKKTQRDKDWPLIRRLVEADIRQYRQNPTQAQLEFWLRECRTPVILMRLARDHADMCDRLPERAGILAKAAEEDVASLEAFLAQEEAEIRAADQKYWEPLQRELREMRRERGLQ